MNFLYLNSDKMGEGDAQLGRRLEARGARIATCGTCLEHSQRQEMLQIGEVGNMADTVQMMAMATRVIRPC